MKLRPRSFLHFLCLDKIYCLLSVRNASALTYYFNLLDVHKRNALNDLQFYSFLGYVTDLTKEQIMLVFDLLDWDGTGEIGFDEFYMLVCIIMAHEVTPTSKGPILHGAAVPAKLHCIKHPETMQRWRDYYAKSSQLENLDIQLSILETRLQILALTFPTGKLHTYSSLTCQKMHHLEKQFMYRHCHPVFELLDIDGGHTIGPTEFQATRFLFNIKKVELSQIFKVFDITGDEQLNYKEFKMFTIFCIDRQEKKAREKMKRKEKAEAEAEAEAESDQFDSSEI